MEKKGGGKKGFGVNGTSLNLIRCDLIQIHNIISKQQKASSNAQNILQHKHSYQEITNMMKQDH